MSRDFPAPLIITREGHTGVQVNEHDQLSVLKFGYDQSSGRMVTEYRIGTADFHYQAADLKSGVGQDPEPSEALSTLMSFLLSDAEKVRYARHYRNDEPDFSFPPHVAEWAYENQSELEYLQSDLDYLTSEGPAEVRDRAYEWHSGMWSPLYAFASSGIIVDPMELLEEIGNIDDIEDRERLVEFVVELTREWKEGDQPVLAPWAQDWI